MAEIILFFAILVFSIVMNRIFRKRRESWEKFEEKFLENCIEINSYLKQGIGIENSIKKIGIPFKSFEEYVNFSWKNVKDKTLKRIILLIIESLKNNLSIGMALTEVENLSTHFFEERKQIKVIRKEAKWLDIFSFFVFPLSFFFLTLIVEFAKFQIFLISVISSINLLVFSSVISKRNLELLPFIPTIIYLNYLIFLSQQPFYPIF